MFKVLNEIKQSSRCSTVAADKNDEYFAFSEGNILKIFNTSDINILSEVDPVNMILTGNDIIYARFNPSGDKIAIGDMDYRISIYNVQNFSQITSLEPGTLKTWKFEFAPTKSELASGCYSVMIYDIDSNEKIYELNNDLKYIHSLCYIDSQTIAAGNANGSINIFSLDTLKRVHKIEEHCMTVRALAVDTANQRLISASDDLHINIMDSQNFKIILPLVGHKDFISSLAVNSQHGVYASGSYDGTVKIWDSKQLKCIQTLNLPNTSTNEEANLIWDVSFSNDGKRLYVASDYGCHILGIS